jgi:hypothetical protein
VTVEELQELFGGIGQVYFTLIPYII